MVSSVTPISKSLKKIWDKWNLRSFIMLSLTLQTFLILCAPLRKRSSSKWVIIPIWLAYLLADWAANFAIGLIASSQTDTDEKSPRNGNLLAFWAPFLLLHLGGPDTIIAIAMEDDALWPRHLLGLIFQAVAAAYVFGMQFSDENKLLWPTLLLFLPGLVKYGERTRALYLASLESLKETILAVPEPGPDYAKYMDEYASRDAAGLPITIKSERGRGSDSKNVTYQLGEGKIDDIALIQGAHHLFQNSMGLIIDLVFDFHQRSESRAYFKKLTTKQAFKSIAIELNFMYEALYTKLYVVHSPMGYSLRATSLTAVCIAFVFFYQLEKHDFLPFDVAVTYSLLFGAIALDLIAIFMLIFSDWTLAVLCDKSSIATNIMRKLRSSQTTTKFLPKSLFRRWSESVYGFSFTEYSIGECGLLAQPTSKGCFDLLFLVRLVYLRINSIRRSLWLKLIKFFGLKDLLDQLKYRSNTPMTMEVWDYIFEELKSKSLLADAPEIGSEICSSRGNCVLQKMFVDQPELPHELLYYVNDVTYDRSLLLWHIATELCFYKDQMSNLNHQHRDTDQMSNLNPQHRDISKTLSDYMLYLLIMQPSLMSSVAGIGQKRFRDTVAEAKKFYKKRGLGSEVKAGKEANVKLDEEANNVISKAHVKLGVEGCRELLGVDTRVKPADVKGNRSKSVLFDACILAKLLQNLGDSKWELLSAVWVELLSYAASHCRAHSHAQLLTKGGELVTFVWLLMARFGIAQEFQVLEVQARVKLIMRKPHEAAHKK